MADTTSPLQGKALLQKLEELSHLSKKEKAQGCGYYTVTKDGQVRANLADFMEALLEAKGVSIRPEGVKDGRGREPTYRVSVHKNGQIVIGSTYTQEMGLKPGDEFAIKLGYKHIRLNHLGTEDTDSEEEGTEEEGTEETGTEETEN